MGLARSDEPELSFLCFLWGLPGFDPLLSPSPSISSGLAPSKEPKVKQLALSSRCLKFYQNVPKIILIIVIIITIGYGSLL